MDTKKFSDTFALCVAYNMIVMEISYQLEHNEFKKYLNKDNELSMKIIDGTIYKEIKEKLNKTVYFT